MPVFRDASITAKREVERPFPKGLLRLTPVASRQLLQAIDGLTTFRLPRGEWVAVLLWGPEHYGKPGNWLDIPEGFKLTARERNNVPAAAIETIDGRQLAFVYAGADPLDLARWGIKLVDYSAGKFVLIDAPVAKL